MKLECLGGREPLPEVASDLARLLDLPDAARLGFWQVLGPSLADVVTPATEELIEGFCTAFDLDRKALAHSLKACRFLVREAARHDLSADLFAQDLDALGAAPELRELLLAGYAPAIAGLRLEMTRNALTDHGKLLVGVEWRVDTVEASNRGLKIKTPVALMTFRYRKGGDTHRVTFQLTPDMIGQLKSVCDQMLG